VLRIFALQVRSTFSGERNKFSNKKFKTKRERSCLSLILENTAGEHESMLILAAEHTDL